MELVGRVAIASPYRRLKGPPRRRFSLRKREKVLLIPLIVILMPVCVPPLLWLMFNDMLLRRTGWCFMSHARIPRVRMYSP
jgi:hypothetical protein